MTVLRQMSALGIEVDAGRRRRQSGWRGVSALAAVLGLLIGSACSGTTAPSEPSEEQFGMEVTAAASLVQGSGPGIGPGVYVSLNLRNRADTTARIYWGECASTGPLVVRASRTGNSTPAWSSLDAYAKVICDLVRHYADVAPGQHWEYDRTIPVRDILGDSLAAGSYAFTASAQFLEPGFSNSISAGVLTLP